MSQPLRLLLLEDSDDDADLMLRELRKGDMRFEVRRVETEEAFREQLAAFNPDLILSDYALPTYDGLSALAAARETTPQTPFIFVSGTMGEETAVDALKQGAVDYVLKDGLIRLRPAVRRALQERAEHQQRLQAEAQIRYQASLLQNVSDAIISTDPDFVIRTWNKGAEAVYGWSAAEVIGRPFRDIVPTRHQQHEVAHLLQALRQDGYWEGEVIQQHKSGKQLTILSSSSLIHDDDKNVTGVVVVNRDITSHRQAEQALKESQALYAAIIACSPLPIMSLDLDGVVLTWNEAAEEIFGWRTEEVVGRFNPIVPPEKEAEFTAFREQIKTGGSFTGIEVVRYNKAGERLDLALSTAPIRNAQDEIVAIMASFEDITERKRVEAERARWLEHQILAEREQAAQRQRLQQILDTVPDGVVLLDADHKVTLANPAGQTLLLRLAQAGINDVVGQMGGKSLPELLTAANGLSQPLEHDDGHFELLARPIALDSGNGGWVLLVRDVTAEFEQEQYMEVQQRLATVGQLAAGIAHDFNNVMAVITLYTQLLQKTANLSDNEQRKLDTVYKQAQHASDMITQILDFSRRSVMERLPINLPPLFKELVKLLRTTLPETIQIDLDHQAADYVVMADPTRLQQAFMNIALNARDAMPDGGRLRLSLSQLTLAANQPRPLPDMEPGNWLQITIVDEGTGIAQEHLSRIFDPFFTTKEPGKGTGLGLAQVYGIVKQHDGSIAVDSTPGQGTTFTIYLPMFTTSVQTDSTPLSIDQSMMGTETILLVEDNHIMRKSVADTLAELGYRVLEADNGVTAVNVLTREHEGIDLVLSDVVMPQMGGVAFYQHIKQAYPSLPLLLMTGYPLGQQAPELVGLPWIAKPFTIQALLTKIRAMLGE
jgi:two-component system, cell cycle sensor histidine kinase and response regulator CckA